MPSEISNTPKRLISFVPSVLTAATLGEEVLVDPDGHLMGAFGAALLAADAPQSKRKPFSFNIDNIDFTTREVVCQKCANHCEIVCVYRDDELIDTWGNRCDKGAIRPHSA